MPHSVGRPYGVASAFQRLGMK